MKRELFYIIRMKFIDSKSDYGIYVIKKKSARKKACTHGTCSRRKNITVATFYFSFKDSIYSSGNTIAGLTPIREEQAYSL